MNTFRTGRVSAIAAVTILLATASSPAAAYTPPPPAVGTTVTVVDGLHCPLQRIGIQYVRCDDLTGAGRAAPEWVPEQTSPIVHP